MRERRKHRERASYLPAPAQFNLNHACVPLWSAFGDCYLVGSSLERRDFRDVDIRCILPDEEFNALFPDIGRSKSGSWMYSSRWSVMCASISEWLSRQSGLPVDFQFQRQTDANNEFKGVRSAIGMFLKHDQEQVKP